MALAALCYPGFLCPSPSSHVACCLPSTRQQFQVEQLTFLWATPGTANRTPSAPSPKPGADPLPLPSSLLSPAQVRAITVAVPLAVSGMVLATVVALAIIRRRQNLGKQVDDAFDFKDFASKATHAELPPAQGHLQGSGRGRGGSVPLLLLPPAGLPAPSGVTALSGTTASEEVYLSMPCTEGSGAATGHASAQHVKGDDELATSGGGMAPAALDSQPLGLGAGLAAEEGAAAADRGNLARSGSGGAASGSSAAAAAAASGPGEQAARMHRLGFVNLGMRLGEDVHIDGGESGAVARAQAGKHWGCVPGDTDACVFLFFFGGGLPHTNMHNTTLVLRLPEHPPTPPPPPALLTASPPVCRFIFVSLRPRAAPQLPLARISLPGLPGSLPALDLVRPTE